MLDFLTDVIGYSTARLLLPMLTCGKVQAQDFTDGAPGHSWLGVKRGNSGRYLIEPTAAAILGLLFWVLALVCVLAIVR